MSLVALRSLCMAVGGSQVAPRGTPGVDNRVLVAQSAIQCTARALLSVTIGRLTTERAWIVAHVR